MNETACCLGEAIAGVKRQPVNNMKLPFCFLFFARRSYGTEFETNG